MTYQIERYFFYWIKILLASIIFISFVMTLGSCQSKKDGNDLVVFSLEDSNSGKKDQITVPRKYLKKENYRGNLRLGGVYVFTSVPIVDSLDRGKNRVIEPQVVIEHDMTLIIYSNAKKSSELENVRRKRIDKYKTYPVEIPGLAGRYAFCKMGEECHDDSVILFFSEDDREGEPVRLRCPKAGVPSNCMVTSSYRGWEIKYFFKGEKVFHWEEFDRHSRNLLSNFFSD